MAVFASLENGSDDDVKRYRAKEELFNRLVEMSKENDIGSDLVKTLQVAYTKLLIATHDLYSGKLLNPPDGDMEEMDRYQANITNSHVLRCDGLVGNVRITENNKSVIGVLVVDGVCFWAVGESTQVYATLMQAMTSCTVMVADRKRLSCRKVATTASKVMM